MANPIDIIDSSDVVDIRGLTFTGVAGIAVRVIGTHKAVRIRDCNFIDCERAIAVGGDSPTAQANLGTVKISGCHVEGCTGASAIMVLARHAAILDCTILNTAGDPIYTKGRRCVIGDNHIDGTAGAHAGIFCKGAERGEGSGKADGYGMIVSRNTVSNVDAPGIYTAAGRAQILGNLIEGATGIGIVAASSLTGEHLVIGNTIADLTNPNAGIKFFGPGPSGPGIPEGAETTNLFLGLGGAPPVFWQPA